MTSAPKKRACRRRKPRTGPKPSPSRRPLDRRRPVGLDAERRRLDRIALASGGEDDRHVRDLVEARSSSARACFGVSPPTSTPAIATPSASRAVEPANASPTSATHDREECDRDQDPTRDQPLLNAAQAPNRRERMSNPTRTKSVSVAAVVGGPRSTASRERARTPQRRRYWTITCRWISDVPSTIWSTFASRIHFSTGWSRMIPAPPRT